MRLTLFRRSQWHRWRGSLLREFSLFVVSMYGFSGAAGLALVVWSATVTHVRPRLDIAWLLVLVLVLSWVSGYAAARWVRS